MSYKANNPIPGIEFGHPVVITELDGRKFVPPARVETKATGTAAPARAPERPPGGVPQTTWAPGVETITWLEVPDACVTPQTRRAAEIALEAARLELRGLPEGLTVRYMQPYERGLARLYQEIAGAEIKTFANVPRTGGTYFPSRPDEVWVNVGQDTAAIAHYAVHECVHLWRARVGAGGLSPDEVEAEADELGDRLLPLVVAAAADEGGLGPGPGARW